MVTRRTTQREYLLRPDDELNEIFLYCLAEAAQRFGIELMFAVAMSNHHHTLFRDHLGTINEFKEHFHKMTAKCVNALRGRWENCWSSEPPCDVQLVERQDVIEKLVYAATNPVKDHLVERVHHWPGVNTLNALYSGREIVVSRPLVFFDEDGSMPETVTLRFTIPEDLGDIQGLLQTVRERVKRFEEEKMAERLQNGHRILGRARVLRQSWRASPTSWEPRRTLRPRVAARSKWSRIAALQRNQVFIAAYRKARVAWLAGTPIPFPRGTYWLRRFAGVPVEPN